MNSVRILAGPGICCNLGDQHDGGNVTVAAKRRSRPPSARPRVPPVVDYSTLMAVAYGCSAKDAVLNGRVIPAKKLEAIAGK